MDEIHFLYARPLFRIEKNFGHNTEKTKIARETGFPTCKLVLNANLGNSIDFFILVINCRP